MYSSAGWPKIIASRRNDRTVIAIDKDKNVMAEVGQKGRTDTRYDLRVILRPREKRRRGTRNC